MNKSTIILISLLLVLGAVTYFLLPSQKEHESSYEPSDLNVKVDSASVVKIEIEQKGKSVTIENVGGKWMITSPLRYAADATSIKQLLSGLSKFRVGSLISSNPEKQNIFQVDSTGTRISVTDRSGKPVALVVGKMGPSFSEVYFRLPASKDVYLGEGLDTWMINKEARDWRDKTILIAPSETLRALTSSVGNKRYEFHRDSTVWKAGGKAVDVSVINPALTSLSNLHADDFADAPASIQSHPATVKVHASDDVTLTFFPVLPDSS